MTWMTLLLACGAVLRLTRLLNADTITFPLRDWLAGKSEDALDLPCKKKGKSCTSKRFFGFVEDMIACPWCLSIWIAAVVVPCAYLFGDTGWFVVPALLLCASQMAGMVMTGGK